jgi:hypothetical protein
MDEPLSQYFAFIIFMILYIGLNILYDCLNCFAMVIYFAFVGGQIYSNCYYLSGWTLMII